MIKTIYSDGQAVMLLDQSQLPERIVYEKCTSPEEVASAIKTLKVRGAPLIGVTAAFGIALAVKNYTGSTNNLKSYFLKVKELLGSTRPTAVNLSWALERMEKIYNDNASLDIKTIAERLMEKAQEMFEQDIRINKAIGKHGEQLLGKNSRVMTICNAGALATCGYGTALGVIRAGAEKNKISQVFACETRPVLQGSRLTVWELMRDSIPVILITDSMAGYVMEKRNIDAVIVGADRIAANGDTANKIGTYTLAVLAQYHKIPFYTAAPFSTIDLSIAAGTDIPIEEREQDEVRKVQNVYLTVPDVEVFNPAFDVTPNELITAIITEKGVIKPSFKENLESLNREGSW
jgi:methylthioribose-1-phosphate isomerase